MNYKEKEVYGFVEDGSCVHLHIYVSPRGHRNGYVEIQKHRHKH